MFLRGKNKKNYLQVLVNTLPSPVSTASASISRLWASPLTLLSLPPTALQCPPHSLYTHCLPSCLPSCSDPEGLCGGTIQKVASTCREGCVCEPGYVLRNDKCVLKIECDCEDAHGVLIPVSGRGEWDAWGWEVARRMKHLFCKCENLTLNPYNLWKLC